MKRFLLGIAAVAALGGFGGVALAGTAAAPAPSALHALCILRFESDLAFTAACPPEDFSYYDADGDGVIGPDEALCELRLTAGLECTP